MSLIDKILEKLVDTLGGFCTIVLPLALLTAWPVRCFWNWFLTEFFGFHPITFWIAFGLSVLWYSPVYILPIRQE